jgi:2-polyprenyl-3-methyl-5-hydroxy-6-metoxy-1,4-benzoquinol methylase
MTEPTTNATQKTDKRLAMLEVNARQSAFYDAPFREGGNTLMRMWERARNLQGDLCKHAQIYDAVYERHWQWMGDLSGKRVLDLGCHEGNRLSLSIARQAKSYLGIDLSKTGIQRLQQRLRDNGLAHAEAKVLDFLSPDFNEGSFDIVYAHSVAHHFQHFDVLLQAISKCLAPNGSVITLDPLQTSLPARTVRALYRPFQPDKDWEWPFSKQTFEQIEQQFRIVGVQGILGRSKWVIPVALFNMDYAVDLGKRLHARDLAEASSLGNDLWRCLQVTMCWKKK